MPPVALCCCFLLLSSFRRWFLSLRSPSLSHWDEPRATVPHTESQPQTELEPGPRVSSSQSRAPACGPGCLAGERAVPLPVPPCPAEEEVALFCPIGYNPVSIGCRGSGTTQPAFLGMLSVHLHCQRPSPLPHPTTWARAVSGGEGASSDPQNHLLPSLSL